MPQDRRDLFGRVYVIDDDPAVLESTAFLLQSFGFECATFASARQFLDVFGTLDPGCILTDLSMPEMDGWALRKALEERSNDWPMFLMSSECGGELEGSTMRSGFSGFFPKPLDAESFAAIVGSLSSG